MNLIMVLIFVRFKSFETAFSLAIDMNDADLFMVLHEKAKTNHLVELAEESFKKAEEINNSSNISDNDDRKYILSH